MDFALHVPANNVSFGQVSIAILRELHKRELEPSIFPIGSFEINGQQLSKEFIDWLNMCLNKAPLTYKRSTPVIKLWHIFDSLQSYGERQVLYTFHELDSATSVEANHVANQHKTIFSSRFSKDVFEKQGLTNIASAPLGFDKDNFFVKEKKFFSDGRIVFNLAGKLERRKHHTKIIQAWVKKYGNNPRYVLQCSLYNSFMRPEDQQQMLAQALEGRRYFNVEFLPYMSTNSEYNDYLNAGDIIIGMSGGEGFGLPEMQSIALGKHAVILNAHGYKEFATERNAVLVEPSGKIEAYDNIFFHKGAPFNQGNLFTWTDESFIDACEKAIARVKSNPVNSEGLKLQDTLSYANLVDILLESIN